MRKNNLGSGVTVGVNRPRIAPQTVQESMDLTLCVMKSAGTRPSIRACVDATVSVLIYDAAQFPCNNIDRFFPSDGYKAILSSQFVRLRCFLLIPALSYHRRLYSCRAIQKV